MFGSSLRLPFRLLGIPVRLDSSFLLILPLLAWLIGSQIPAYLELFRRLGLNVDPGALQQGIVPFLLGLVAALGLFGSVLVHELGHALVARLYGVEVKEITLWFLGGVAQFEELPRQRGAEAVVAIAGPITSVLLAGLFWWAWHAVASGPALLFVLSYLTITNAGLAVFNLLPALPLDGGRVLRSLLALALPYLTATRIASAISQVLAILMGIVGFMSFNLFLVVIAFFVYNAGRAETQYAILSDTFADLRVRDLMSRNVLSVEPEMQLANFVQLAFFRKHTGYPVIDANGRLVGFAMLQDASEASPDATVATILQPAEVISPDEPALEALKRISQSPSGRLVVVDGAGRVVGILSKTDLIRTLEQHTQVPGFRS